MPGVSTATRTAAGQAAPGPARDEDRGAPAGPAFLRIRNLWKAFGEFQRVLRDGGVLSIFEPINRFAFPEPEGRFAGFDVTLVLDLARKVEAVYTRIQPIDTDPMTDFDERDLFSHAEDAGFSEASSTGSTKHAESCPSGRPAFISVGEFGSNRRCVISR